MITGGNHEKRDTGQPLIGQRIGNHRERSDRNASDPPAFTEDEIERVRAVVQELSPRDREVLLLREFSELSYAQIAEVVAGHRSIKHALEWLLKQQPPLAPCDMVTQDEFSGSLVNGQFEETFVNNFRIIGQGPGNNFLIHENAHLTINANGDVTVTHDNFSAVCK